MDLKSLIAKMDAIIAEEQAAPLTPQQQAQNTLQPGMNPAPAADPRAAEYARAQKQMANLEAAAKYTGDDEIVRSRMGLPAKLPPIEQWDGKMPAPVGKPDWLGSIGGGDQRQANAVKVNAADDTSVLFMQQKLGELKALLAKLAPASNATVNTTGAPANMGAVIKEGKIASNLIKSFGY